MVTPDQQLAILKDEIRRFEQCLDGLSSGTRARLSRSILEALPEQRDQDLRQTYLWAVSQLVTDYGNRALDQEFYDVLALVDDLTGRVRAGLRFADAPATRIADLTGSVEAWRLYLQGRDALLAIPTPDHYLPLLYVLGAMREEDEITFPVEGVDGGSGSMLTVRIG